MKKLKKNTDIFFIIMDKSKEEGKYQESIQLNTTPLTRHQMGK